MKNKELQILLQQYPDDIVVYCDTTFGWELPDNKNYVDVYIHPQCQEDGELWGLEIGPEKCRSISTETIDKILSIINSDSIIQKIYDKFEEKYN